MVSEAQYVTAQEIAMFLGWVSGTSVITLSGSTTPTQAHVESIISAAERDVERRTKRNWRGAGSYLSHTQKNSWSYKRQRTIQRGIYAGIIQIELEHAFIQDVSSILFWNGNEQEDYVATKTEGVAMFDGDWFVEKETGTLYISGGYPSQSLDNISITYTYGEETVHADAKLATMYLTGATLQTTYGSLFQRGLEDSRGAGNYIQQARDFREEASRIIDQISMIKSANLLS